MEDVKLVELTSLQALCILQVIQGEVVRKMKQEKNLEWAKADVLNLMEIHDSLLSQFEDLQKLYNRR